MSINQADVNNKLNFIFSTLELIEKKIENIEKQIKDINSVYMNYEFNKNLNLNQPNSYLKFQVDLLNNEKKYYNGIRNIFLTKFVKELYNISEYIILILISMEDLDLGYQSEKQNIMKKVLKIKKIKNANSGTIFELINITINNLKLTKKFVDLFENFILSHESDDRKKNIHSKNLNNNLTNKKNHYELEYKKYLDQLNILIDYFNQLALNVNNQFKNHEILKFFICPEV